MFRIFARLGVIVLSVVLVLLGSGAFAVAHVTVHADQALRGGQAEIVFRVPTEGDSASTIKVEVALPTDTPIANVAVRPLPGWTYSVTKEKLSNPVADAHGNDVSEVVGRIAWTATDPEAAPGPGEYQDFQMVAKPLPDTDQLVFKVVQTYDDGTVSRWIELPVNGGPEPEFPAPVLALTGSAPSGGHGGHGEVAAPAGSSRVTTPTTTPPAWWAGVGIASVALIAALATGYLALRTTRRKGGGSPG